MRIEPDSEGKTTVTGGRTIECREGMNLDHVIHEAQEEAYAEVMTLVSGHGVPIELMTKGTIVVRIEVEHDPKGTVADAE